MCSPKIRRPGHQTLNVNILWLMLPLSPNALVKLIGITANTHTFRLLPTKLCVEHQLVVHSEWLARTAELHPCWCWCGEGRGGGGLDWTLWWEAEPGRDLAEKMRAEDWVLSAARMATWGCSCIVRDNIIWAYCGVRHNATSWKGFL